jgi:hypothetical protein
MLPIHLAMIIRKIRDGETAGIPSPDSVVPTRVIVRVAIGFLVVVALLFLWSVF